MPTSSDGTVNPAPSTSSGSTKKGRGGKRKKNTGRPDDHPKHPAPGDPSSVGSGANRNRKCNGNRRLLSCALSPAYWFALTVLMVAFMVLRRGSTRISGFSQATPGAAGSRDFKAKVRQNTAAEETSLDSSSNARDEECISTKPNSFFSWSFPWSFPKLEVRDVVTHVSCIVCLHPDIRLTILCQTNKGDDNTIYRVTHCVPRSTSNTVQAKGKF